MNPQVVACGIPALPIARTMILQARRNPQFSHHLALTLAALLLL
jgi:hypothetical protein